MKPPNSINKLIVFLAIIFFISNSKIHHQLDSKHALSLKQVAYISIPKITSFQVELYSKIISTPIFFLDQKRNGDSLLFDSLNCLFLESEKNQSDIIFDA